MRVAADFQPFFTASVAASAALIGLLFVSELLGAPRGGLLSYVWALIAALRRKRPEQTKT